MVQFSGRLRDALAQRDAHCMHLQRRVDHEMVRRRASAEGGPGTLPEPLAAAATVLLTATHKHAAAPTAVLATSPATLSTLSPPQLLARSGGDAMGSAARSRYGFGTSSYVPSRRVPP